MSMERSMNKSFLLISTCLISACSLAPGLEIPETLSPKAYKEQMAEKKGEWKEIKPLEASDRGQWWKIFGEEPLTALEEEAIKTSPSLQAAAARVEQARAIVSANAPTFLPQIDIGGNAVRSQPASAGVAAFGGNPNANLKPYTLYSAGATASYEVDLFGRVRDNAKALESEADAEDAMYKSVLLALAADVADHYFGLRALDAERAMLRDTVNIRKEALRIMRKRFEAGEVGAQDMSRAEADLGGIEAELLMLDRNRATMEHALAVLLGKLPTEFTFAETPLNDVPPEIPAGLPSSLLARRPDVSAAVSAMAAANARIGVARTALLPQLILTASGGAESTTLGDLFTWSNRTWALGQLAGDALSMTLFDSGRNLARIDAADAAYQEAVANYKQQVLVAFRDVEDGLAAERLLAEQAQKANDAATSAVYATGLVQKRYDEGYADYFEVVEAQRNSLAAQRAGVQTRGQRFLATVELIRALGGGWDETALVKPEEAKPEAPKTEEIKPAAEEAKPEAPKAEEPKPEISAPEEPKPEPPKPDGLPSPLIEPSTL
jgi:outer membrane protein, multidrug efflux system